jgi:hypothetical protein
MKKLINFLFVLALGVFLGYVFHNPIDTKLKTKFGTEKVETVRATAEEKLGDFAEKGMEAGKAALKTSKEVLDSTNIK